MSELTTLSTLELLRLLHGPKLSSVELVIEHLSFDELTSRAPRRRIAHAQPPAPHAEQKK